MLKWIQADNLDLAIVFKKLNTRINISILTQLQNEKRNESILDVDPSNQRINSAVAPKKRVKGVKTDVMH